MDFGNLQQEMNNAILVFVAIITGTFQSSTPPKIISPLPAEYKTQSKLLVEEAKESTASADYKNRNEAIVSQINVKENTERKKANRLVAKISPQVGIEVLGDDISVTPTIVITERIELPSLTPTPTITPTPTYTPIPTVTKAKEIVLQIPTPAEIMTRSSLNSDAILSLINNHRKELGYTSFEKDEKLCELARYRGPQLEDEIFKTGAIHKGLYDLNLPYQIIENMASYSSEQQVFNWWMSSRLHRSAIEGNYKYSCGICNGNSCAQLFTNYTPR